jgi:uncharacterized ferritin-like protein (DUF455 family)
MELREFAEQVLFATTLEQKLQSPGLITDARPGAALVAPESPGRPAELRFKPKDKSAADFPGIHRLEREHERGRLLHFFANHELLATELMALVLLRFPDAPTAFRRGVLQTLKDEQLHTRLYIQRMKECGISFGELPVSGYFWRAVSPMENPMDYVASLSLTFEQANLDFCRYFARGFEIVGDDKTAGLLENIYQDEIGHVAQGLKWFRRWKNPQESDWEAFIRQLKFPLSPQRAKGLTLNIEGRRAAGLGPEFIAELNVYSHSRGRTPNVYWFNPMAEGRIAEGNSFNPVNHQVMLARDLANLPQFLCRQDDVVLLEDRPSVEFLSTIKEAGFPLPEFVELNKAKSLADRKIGSLRPWAWGPDSVDLLQPLFASVTGEQRSSSQRFNPATAPLYSKAWSAAFLRNFLAANRRNQPSKSNQIGKVTSLGEEWLCTPDEVGVAIDNFEDAVEAIETIRRRGHHPIVVKQAIGMAGHNSIRLLEPELLESQRHWIRRSLDNSRQLVIEPWLNRVVDFSVQLEMGPGGLKLCGYTGLVNDLRGQFQGNWADPNYSHRLPQEVVQLFPQPGASVLLLRLYGEIFSLLENELRRADYLGPLGIDALVYRSPEGEVRLKPIVEINPRFTMGRLMVELMKRTLPGCHGQFRLVTRSMARAEGAEDFSAYARLLSERYPLRFAGDPVRKISNGVLCLNAPARAQFCLAVFQVSGATESVF